MGPAGPGGPASPWQRDTRKDPEVRVVARRWHRGRRATSLAQGPAKGRPYLVTRSTSGAGGANGASQASETVFARSAISTFGTRVALGGEDTAGLPAELQPRGGTPLLCTPLLCTPGSSSSPEGLSPSSSSSLAMQKSRAQLPARSKGLSPRGTSVPEHPIPVAPALLRGAPAGGGASGCRREQGCEQRMEGTHRDLGDTYSVTLGAWQAGSTTFSGHPLQTGGPLVSGGTGSTSITLGERDGKEELASNQRRFGGENSSLEKSWRAETSHLP